MIDFNIEENKKYTLVGAGCSHTQGSAFTVLKDNKANGGKNYVYGASTKGNTMLQFWKLHGLFEGAAEIHPDKIGRYTVGTQIPIVSEEDAKKDADFEPKNIEQQKTDATAETKKDKEQA